MVRLSAVAMWAPDPATRRLKPPLALVSSGDAAGPDVADVADDSTIVSAGDGAGAGPDVDGGSARTVVSAGDCAGIPASGSIHLQGDVQTKWDFQTCFIHSRTAGLTRRAVDSAWLLTTRLLADTRPTRAEQTLEGGFFMFGTLGGSSFGIAFLGSEDRENRSELTLRIFT